MAYKKKFKISQVIGCGIWHTHLLLSLATMKLNVIPHRPTLFSVVLCAGLVAFSQNASANRHPMPPSQAHLLAPYQFFTNGPIGNLSDELNYLQTHGGGSYQPTFLPATSEFLGKFQENGTISNGAINISTYVMVDMVSSKTTQEWPFLCGRPLFSVQLR
jgi:hypothetical protein